MIDAAHNLKQKWQTHNVHNMWNYSNVLMQMSDTLFRGGKIIIPVVLTCWHARRMSLWHIVQVLFCTSCSSLRKGGKRVRTSHCQTVWVCSTALQSAAKCTGSWKILTASVKTDNIVGLNHVSKLAEPYGFNGRKIYFVCTVDMLYLSVAVLSIWFITPNKKTQSSLLCVWMSELIQVVVAFFPQH